MSNKIKVKKKEETDREKLDAAIRRDEISLLRNLMRKYKDIAADEIRKLLRQTV